MCEAVTHLFFEIANRKGRDERVPSIIVAED